MINLFRRFLAIMLLVLMSAVPAQSQKLRPISQGPDLSDFVPGQMTDGKLTRIEKFNIAWIRKYDPTRANQIKSQLKQKKTSRDKLSDAYKNLVKAREQLVTFEKLDKDGIAGKEQLARVFVEQLVRERLLVLAHNKYKFDLKSTNFVLTLKDYERKKVVWFDRYDREDAKRRKKMGLPLLSIGHRLTLDKNVPHKSPTRLEEDEEDEPEEPKTDEQDSTSVSQGAKDSPKTCRVCKKSGLLGGLDCVAVRIENGQC